MTAVAIEHEFSDWQDVCALDLIVPWTGVCALIGGRQVAIVRTADAVYAIGNFDPFSKAFVLSRGIVGDKGGIPKIASPIFKQTFDLRTGQCLDNPTVRVPTYEVRVERGRVLVHREPRPGEHDGA
ncbi:MAG: nitrite reductase small subunit NirD [Myxococcaceae bacterium]